MLINKYFYRLKDQEFLKYIVVGIISLLLDVLISTFVFEITKLLNFSILLGYLSSVFFGYFGHRKVTFLFIKGNAFYKYCISVAVVYLLNYYSVKFFKVFFYYDSLLYPKIFTIPIVTLASFCLLKYFVFKTKKNFYD